MGGTTQRRSAGQGAPRTRPAAPAIPPAAGGAMRGEIDSLTALRGIAALYVALLHFSATAQQHCVTTIPALAPRGHLGVDFFFVLSGFIMGYTYGGDFARHGLAAMPAFLAKRVARILPLQVAVVLLIGLAAVLLGPVLIHVQAPWLNNPNLGWDMAANMLLLHELGIGRNLNGPSWSISVEFAAYLLFPLFLWCVFSPRRAVGWIGLALALAGLCALALPQEHLSVESTGRGRWWDLLRCVCEFTLGLFAYRFYLGVTPKHPIASDAAAIALSVAIAAIMLFKLGDLFAVLLFPFLVLSFAHNDGLCNRVATARLPVFLGAISYSIYLIHDPLRPLALETLRRLHPAPLEPVAALAFAAAGTLLVIPPAWVAYRCIEKPARGAVRRLLLRRTQERPAWTVG